MALDAFRGLTVAAMLLVNNPGDWRAVYPELRHAAWNGWTAADLVFPFFLFAVGITTQLALGTASDAAVARRRVARRAAAIFAVGLVLNWFPFYEAVPGVHGLARVTLRIEQLRVPGVLQRIALTYAAAALVSWRAPTRRLVAIVGVILVGYWGLMTLVPVPGSGQLGSALLNAPSQTLAAWVDRALFDWSRAGLGNHLWEATRSYDPEGVLSTIPSVATVLIGVFAGRWVTDASRPIAARVRGLAVAGAIGIAAGTAWALVFPINKQLWTSSYVLLSGGCAALALAAALWLVDVRGWRRGTAFLLAFGANPLVAYAGSEVLAHLLHAAVRPTLGGRHLPAEAWTAGVLGAAGLSPRAASLGFSVLFVLLVWTGVAWLYRRHIYIRL